MEVISGEEMRAEAQALLGQISEGKSHTVTAYPEESVGRGYSSAYWTNVVKCYAQVGK